MSKVTKFSKLQLKCPKLQNVQSYKCPKLQNVKSYIICKVTKCPKLQIVQSYN